MSTKTLRKRIALVAVSALTAGLFSVVSAPVANAGEAAAGASGVILVSGSICTATNGVGGAPIAADASGADASPFESGSAAGRIIVVPVGGSIKVAYDAADKITMSGPLNVSQLFTQGGDPATTSATISTTNGKTIINGDDADADVTISALSVGTGVLTVDTANADPTVTAANTIYVNVVAACTNTAFSASTSYVYVKGTDGTAAVTTTNVDAQLHNTVAGNSLYINLTLNNAYAAALNTGLLAASATNGALINAGNDATTAPVKGTTSAITLAQDGTSILRVDPSQTATTSTTVVSITHNGSPIASKTLTFYGEQAKIVIGTVFSGSTSDSDDGTFTYTYQDSAGNTVPGPAASGVGSSYGTQVTQAASVKEPQVDSATIGGANDVMEAKITGTTGGKTAAGVMTYGCGTTSGTADFQISASSSVNANTLVATVTGKCRGSLSTYTVATDKAKYNIGDVATITIEGKDSSGNPTKDVTQVPALALSVGGGSLTYTIVGSTAAGSAAGNIESFTDGKVSFRAQLTTAGTFNAVASISGTKTAAATTTYTVIDPATVGAVSNAEVLKSIVALIASINKQIAALQKLILRR